MRDFNTSLYTKTVGILPDDLKFIEAIKGKKSRAGKLTEIIAFYREGKHLNNYGKNKQALI